ncbi:MAG TPA: EAL domain-containing protein, partial [Mycobacteriales bacterium]|nr:EAL domain-containing protein [Mycobacteriales bacterium]
MAPITVFDLQQAIAGGELALAYQPEVDLRTGHITAVEALARWTHPVHGPVPPTEFIPLAERAGYISDISLVVVRTAVAQAAEWSRSRWDGGPLPIWVNLSACELADPRLHGRIMSALETTDVAAGQLGIEITETVPMTDTARAAST